MPVLLRVILGVFLTIAGAFTYNSSTGRAANGLPAASAGGHPPLVNWDVVSDNWHGLQTNLRNAGADIQRGWKRLASSRPGFSFRHCQASLPVVIAIVIAGLDPAIPATCGSLIFGRVVFGLRHVGMDHRVKPGTLTLKSFTNSLAHHTCTTQRFLSAAVLRSL